MSFSRSNGFSQKKEQIEIIRADDLFGTERGTIKAQRLIGDVQFRHKNALMYCDSAYYYKETNSIDAFGSIRINQGDTLNLYGDFLNYKGDEQLALVTGDSVQLISNDFDLVTDQLFYNRAENLASYYTGAKIVSKNDSNTLISKRGYFYANQSMFLFKDSVQLTNPNFVMNSDTLRYYSNTEVVNFLGPTTITGDSNLIYCENGWYDTKKDQSQYYSNAYIISDNRKLFGDTLFYDRMKGFGRAKGNIQIIDTTENVIIKGELGKIFEEEDSAVVTDQSLLIQVFDEDSLFMHADTFKVFELENGSRNLLAYYGVRIFKSDLQGNCDSISYSLTDSTIYLLGDPILWSENNQLTADTISILTKRSKIHSIFLDQNAFIISEEGLERFNQIKGKTITGYFKEGRLAKVYVSGSGQSIYFGKDDYGKYIGVNVAESTDINIKLKESGIRKITLINKPKSTMYPMNELDPKTDLRYPGFEWLIEQRPLSKAAILEELAR